MINTFCHMELHSSDTNGSKDFYQKLFGWGMQDMPMGEQTYTMFRTSDSDAEVHGGITRTQCPDNTSAWLSYVLTDDVAGSLQKAVDLGAKVSVDRTEVPQMGWFAIFEDPSGARMGLWQAQPSS